jgi:hypothetical protein
MLIGIEKYKKKKKNLKKKYMNSTRITVYCSVT